MKRRIDAIMDDDDDDDDDDADSCDAPDTDMVKRSWSSREQEHTKQ